jgi:hypothetical protein
MAMKLEKREELSRQLGDYLNRVIYVTLPSIMPNGENVFEGLRKTIFLSFFYFIQNTRDSEVDPDEIREFFWDFARQWVAERIISIFEKGNIPLSLEEIFRKPR